MSIEDKDLPIEDIELPEEGQNETEDDAVVEMVPGKFDKLLGENSRKFKLSGMFKDWFLDYSSYVILYRAVPHIVDGMKPVQRRVLHAMWRIDDGRYTKVANIVGQAMQYHPHGDQSILGALVQLGQKNYLIDCQGNWGNILTGDSNAAPRYIEARLTKFAKEVVFNPKTTNWMTSYDGRNQEPVELPIKFPLLLAQGAEGIAVGLASKILPHNFNELIDASVAYLQGKDFELYPDFPTGGYADCTKYMKGQRGGVVKVRAKIEKIDKNTLSINEIPFGKTTHIIIDSILKAKEKGKIKIKKIDDLTTDKANILIHLPNDVSPDKTIDALYAFTDCEVSISPNTCVIVDHKPQFLSVDDVLKYSTDHTRSLLGQELQIRLEELENEWHYSSLEKIFFENRVYKILEGDAKTWEAQLQEVYAEMLKYQSLLHRPITMDDINKLVEKPVRKISKFDTKAVDEKLRGIEDEMDEVQNHLDHLTEFTINYFKNLKKKYGKAYPRLTELTGFESIAVTKVVSNNAKLYANKAEGFVGIALKKEDNAEYICDCSDLSEIIVIHKDGKYLVTKVSEKAFFGKDILYVGLFDRNDQRTIYNVIYREGKTSVSYAKRFAVTSVTRDKEYDITQGTPGSQILWFTVNHNGEAETVKIYFRQRAKLKKLIDEYDIADQCCVITFNASQLKQTRKLIPEISAGYLTSSMSSLESIIKTTANNDSTFNPASAGLTQRLLTQASYRGISIWPWTVNSQSAFDSFYLMGIWGVTTDYSNFTKNYVKFLKADSDSYEVSKGSSVDVALSYLSYAGDEKAAKKCEMIIIDGGGGISFDGSKITASKAGTYTVVFRYASKLASSKTVYSFTEPVTVTVK